MAKTPRFEGDVVLSFDEANRSGFAVLSVDVNPRLLAFGVVGGSTDERRRRELLKVFYEVEQEYSGDGCRVVAVYMEDQHVEGKQITAKSLRAIWKLRLIAGWIELAATLYRWQSKAVKARKWRRAMYGKRWIKGADRARYKALSIIVVRALFPQLARAKLSHDEAEAILIGVYGAREEYGKGKR